MEPDDESQTLASARQYLRDNWEKGVRCPCCRRYVKLYDYPFNSSMARLLIVIYRAYRDGKVQLHIENELTRLGMRSVQVQSKLVHWGLIEPVPNDDPKKHMSGFYTITAAGVAFVEGQSQVPAKISYFNYTVYRRSGRLITIQQALGKKFDYAELMGYDKAER